MLFGTLSFNSYREHSVVRQYLGIFLLVSIGVVAGVVLSLQREPAPPAKQDGRENTAQGYQGDDREAGQVRVAALETELAALKLRIAALEQTTVPAPATDINAGVAGAINRETQTNTPLFQTSAEPVSVVDALVAAGLDAYTADDIARKQSAVQLRRLELRDKAIREGYIGSDQYREELTALREEEVKVRGEVDATIYDRYLYHTGQTNRVAVRSVMLGSTAEGAGLQAGDVLISYDGDTIYNYNDLRAATLDGERNESVNVRVARNNAEMTLSVSRGPLGIRMDPLRVDPDED